jgi:decaprenylphospho-beta-D-erythro-pentofuranosid-2-ulose 2-reductase
VIDALGQPQSLLILGGTSDIALATAERLAAGRLRRVVLAGRDVAALAPAAQRLKDAGVDEVTTLAFDATDTAAHGRLIDEAFAADDLDVVLLGFGVLGDQARAEADPAHAVHVAQVNYVGALSVGLHATAALRTQGHGVLVVLSSVAGVRARRANFVYGSAKAGLDAFAQGLDDALHGSGARVMIVRPGFVRTKMTTGLRPAAFATTAEAVAAGIASGLRTGSRTVWVPGILRAVMTIARHLPRPIFRRLPG